MTGESASTGLVVGVDGGTPALHATEWAAATAARRHRSLSLVAAMHSPTPYGTGIGMPPDHFLTLETEARSWVERAREVAEEMGGASLEIGTELVVGNPVSVLAERARQAACTVIGGHPPQDHGRLGAVAAGLMGHVPCPVAVVRWSQGRSRPPGEGPVVVGVDGSLTSVEAVVVAYEEAALREAPLIAVHAASGSRRGLFHHHTEGPWGEGPTAEAITLAERLAGMREWYPEVEVERVVSRNRPTDALLRHAASAQLLVVGSTGHREMSGRLLGSTSHALARSAPCPVLVVPRGTRTQTHSRNRRREKTGP
jgi:nucleotide-binding universal stress UspA family protein